MARLLLLSALIYQRKIERFCQILAAFFEKMGLYSIVHRGWPKPYSLNPIGSLWNVVGALHHGCPCSEHWIIKLLARGPKCPNPISTKQTTWCTKQTWLLKQCQCWDLPNLKSNKQTTVHRGWPKLKVTWPPLDHCVVVVHYGCSDDDISSRANVEIYRNFRPISLCESKSRLRRHLAELNFDARQQQLL